MNSDRPIGWNETHVGIVHCRSQDPIEADKPKESVRLSPPRCDEWVADPDDFGPVESENTQSETVVYAEDLVYNNVVWCNPADPVEDRQRREEVA